VQFRIKKGYKLSDGIELKASIKSELSAPGDNVTGRLKFGLAQKVNRDFQLVQFATADDKPIENPSVPGAETPSAGDSVPRAKKVEMELKAKIPESNGSCTEGTELNLNLFVESTVNGRGTVATIESLQLQPLALEAIACPAPLPIP
jgi:hypothetical protein